MKDKELSLEKLKIKEIRKLKTKKYLCGFLKKSALVVSITSFIGAAYVFIECGLNNKSIFNKLTPLDYLVGIIALVVSVFAATEMAEFSEDIKDIKEKISFNEEELNSIQENNRIVNK